MPIETIILRDCLAGLRTDLHPGQVPLNGTPSCSNVTFERGTRRARPGFTTHATLPLAGFWDMYSLAQYVAPSGRAHLVNASGNAGIVTTLTSTQTYGVAAALTGASRLGNVNTYTAAGHALEVGWSVEVAGVPVGAGGTNFNGNVLVVTSVVAGASFTAAQVAANDTAGTGGTATPIYTLDTNWSTGKLRTAQFGDVLYLVDGASAVRKAFHDTTNLRLTAALTAMDAPTEEPSVLLSDEGGMDFVLPGYYWFTLAYANAAGTSISPVGPQVLVYVPEGAVRQIVLSVPAMSKQGGVAPYERAQVYASTPYSIRQDYWALLNSITTVGGPPTTTPPRSFLCYAGSVAPATAVNITAWSRDGAGTLTVTAPGHGLDVGDTVTNAGTAAGAADGTFVVTSIAGNDFLVPQAGGVAAGGVLGTASPTYPLDLGAAYPEKSLDGTPPPTACTLLMEHQGRMVYVGAQPFASATSTRDTLYFSDLFDPETVRQNTPPAVTDATGTYIRIGTDGQEVLALGRLGTYLFAFKRRGVYVLTGSGSVLPDQTRDYQVQQLSHEVGCISHESVVDIEGALYWLSEDTVWRMAAGGLPEEVGQGIRPDIQALSAAYKADASAAYDRTHRTYVVTVHDATYMLDLTTGAWTAIAMPGVSASTRTSLLWADRANTPGMYEAATYKLRRAFTSATTDDGSAIAFSWWSPEFQDPFPGRYKQIERVRVTVKSSAPSVDTLTLKLRANQNTSDNATKAVTLPATAGVPQVVTWRPPLLADLESFRFGFSGTSTGGLEVSLIQIDVSDRGPVR